MILVIFRWNGAVEGMWNIMGHKNVGPIVRAGGLTLRNQVGGPRAHIIAAVCLPLCWCRPDIKLWLFSGVTYRHYARWRGVRGSRVLTPWYFNPLRGVKGWPLNPWTAPGGRGLTPWYFDSLIHLIPHPWGRGGLTLTACWQSCLLS